MHWMNEVDMTTISTYDDDQYDPAEEERWWYERGYTPCAEEYSADLKSNGAGE